MKTTARATCTHPGCTESAFWSFDTRKDAAAHYPQRQKWKCSRHTYIEEVLGVGNMERVTVLESKMVKTLDGERDLGLFWDGSHGFVNGSGYRARASDFPVGTKLIVTVRIELPTGGGGGVLVGDDNATPRSGANSDNIGLTQPE